MVKSMLAVARRPDIVQELLTELFPAAAQHLGGGFYAPSFASEWRRSLRVADFQVLLVYLERGLPGGAVSAHRVREALAVLDDRQALERLIEQTDEQELIRLLARLEDYEGQFELADSAMTVEVLIAACGRLRPRSGGRFEYDAHIATSRLLLRILRTMDSDEVERILAEVQWLDLSSRAELVGMVGSNRSTGARLIGEAAADKMEGELVEAILAAPSEQLREEADLARLLSIAANREPNGTRECLADLIEDRLLLVRWLGQRLREKRSSEGHSYLLPWAHLIQVVDGACLAAAVGNLDESCVADYADEREREAVSQARHYATHPEQAVEDFRAFFGEEPPTGGVGPPVGHPGDPSV